MKKAMVLAASLALLFLGSIATAHAGTHISFGINIGPGIPYGYSYYAYPPYPAYYYQDYYYPGSVIYPAYAYRYYSYGPRRVYVPRYYNYGRQHDRYYNGRSNGYRRSGSGRWRY